MTDDEIDALHPDVRAVLLTAVRHHVDIDIEVFYVDGIGTPRLCISQHGATLWTGDSLP